MKNIHQSSFLNPAFSPEQDYIIGLPFISGINAGFNNAISLNSMTQQGHGFFADTLKFDFNSFYGHLSGNNKSSFEVDVSMFYLGIRGKKNFYSVSVNEKGFFRAGFDKQFIEFFKNGTKPYYGKDSDLGSLSFHFAQYREFGFALSRKENKKLTYGARLKFLFGKLNFEAGNLDFQIKSSSASNFLFLHPSGTIDISGPMRFEVDTVKKTTSMRKEMQANDYFFSFKNLGFATDLGFYFNASKQLSLSASITDLGFLRFSKKNYALEVSSDLVYRNTDLTQTSDPTAPNYQSGTSAIYAFRDSIPYMTTAYKTPVGQWVALPVKVFLSADYRLNKKMALGFVERLYILKDYSYTATTLSVQSEISDSFTATGTWSIIKGSFLNLGFGGVYHSKFVQVFFVTDNIFSVLSPSEAKNLNLHFGINLLIGKG